MRGFIGALVVLLAASCLLTMIPSSIAAVRTDPIDENYITGYFAIMQGRPRLAWTTAASEADDFSFGNDTTGAVDEFTSDPTPRTFYLNVSRPLHLDLFFEGVTEMFLSVEVRAQGALLAGGTKFLTDGIEYCQSAEQKDCAPVSLRPEAAGYGVESHRMQAELDTIGAGSIITVRVIHPDASAMRYGMAQEHRSVLRLPLFSSEDALFRVPKYQRAAWAGSSENHLGPPAVDGLWSLVEHLLGPVAPALLPLSRAGMRIDRRRIAVLVIAVFFSGCASNRPEDSVRSTALDDEQGGSADSYVIQDPDNETGLSHQELGALLGVVSDDEFWPINGASIALIGTAHFERSDPRGRFQFARVEPGTYALHIDHEGFKALDHPVTIEAGGITKVEAVLEYRADKPMEYRPHRHDYWHDASGKRVDSLVVYETDFTGYGEGVRLAPPQTIIPGTVDIELNYTFTGGKPEGAYLRVRLPNDLDHNNDTVLPRRPSGVPFHLRTTWEMTDAGHAHYSDWLTFTHDSDLVWCRRTLVEQFIDQALGCRDPEYRVVVTLHRGVIPLEPAHPNPWGNKEAIPVLTEETQTLHHYCFLLYACPVHFDGPSSTESAYNATWEPTNLTAYETKWLEVTLTTSQPPVPAATNDWEIYYRGAGTTNYGSCYHADSQNRRESKTAPLHSKDSEKRRWTWHVPLDPADPDPPYAKRTNWCIYIATDDDLAYYSNSGGILDQVELTLTVIAHRDKLPT